MKTSDQVKFNIFAFSSTFARALTETFISLYLYKNGFSIQWIIIFYFFVNLFAVPLSYIFVKIGERTKYSYVMIIGLIAFVCVQFFLKNIMVSSYYLLLLALIYSIYRRGYWVSRRFYITKIMPTKKTSGLFSIVLVITQIASIVASYIGAFILENLNIQVLNVLSSCFLIISVIPLFLIKIDKKPKKIKLKDSIKEYRRDNSFAFSFYELNNLLEFILPIYIAIYIENSYSLAGNLNIVCNVAIILFILVYGKVINKNRNYLVISTILVLLCSIFKLYIANYLILIVYFAEGIVKKMQNQSISKIYFENRCGMDLTNYNLIYQMLECSVRALVSFPLIFMNDIKLMIMFVIFVIFILMCLYIVTVRKSDKSKKIYNY